eukprot:10669505-Lingulodinium_polyedra.AAC.1
MACAHERGHSIVVAGFGQCQSLVACVLCGGWSTCMPRALAGKCARRLERGPKHDIKKILEGWHPRNGWRLEAAVLVGDANAAAGELWRPEWERPVKLVT